jgi:excisionase family DNA binding protein
MAGLSRSGSYTGMDTTDPSNPRLTKPSYSAGSAHGTADPTGDLLTAEEVASLLRMTPAWVYAQTRRRRIPHLRLGRYVRYRREALDEWIEQVESSSSLPPGRRRDGNRSALR